MNAASRARVLLVEQDSSVLHSYRARLTKAGFHVAETSRAEDALRRAENQEFDIVVTDFVLPDMNGLELVRRLRQIAGNLQSVLLLDTADNQLSLEAVQSGVFQSLVKPIPPQILYKTVDLAVRSQQEAAQVETVPHHGWKTRMPISFQASDAKNKFARVLEKAIQGEIVLITKHDAPKAVLISVEEFEALSRASERKIDSLTAEFDALFSRMQGPAARKAMDDAFHASPAELGKVAVAAARKRG
jgi:antitoxin Phd